MRILMMIPLWRRPEVVTLFVRNLERNFPWYADLIPLFILSREDPNIKQLEAIVDGYAVLYHPNNPLGSKKNAGGEHALTLHWDYYMDIGSDNLFTRRMWELYQPEFEARTRYFGLKNIYVYDYTEHRAAFAEGYHIGKHDTITALGVGRCIRRDVFAEYMPLWPALPFGLDGWSDMKLYQSGIKCKVIDNGDDPVIVDVKTRVCITPWEAGEDCTVPVDVDFVEKAFDIKGLAIQDVATPDKFHRAVMKTSLECKTVRDAFEAVNNAHERHTGEKRYTNYESYKASISKRFKK